MYSKQTLRALEEIANRLKDVTTIKCQVSDYGTAALARNMAVEEIRKVIAANAKTEDLEESDE